MTRTRDLDGVNARLLDQSVEVNANEHMAVIRALVAE